jgi:hypothetical protein
MQTRKICEYTIVLLLRDGGVIIICPCRPILLFPKRWEWSMSHPEIVKPAVKWRRWDAKSGKKGKGKERACHCLIGV